MKIDISKIKTVEFEKGLKLCADIKSSFGNNEAYVVGVKTLENGKIAARKVIK